MLCARNKTVCAYLSFSMSLDELLFLTKDSSLEFGSFGSCLLKGFFHQEKLTEKVSVAGVASKRIKKRRLHAILFFSLLRV